MKSSCMKSVLTSGLPVVIGMTAPFAHAMQQVTKTFSMPVKLPGPVTAVDCADALGPQVTSSGLSYLAEQEYRDYLIGMRLRHS
jgi:hypothetical protein